MAELSQALSAATEFLQTPWADVEDSASHHRGGELRRQWDCGAVPYRSDLGVEFSDAGQGLNPVLFEAAILAVLSVLTPPLAVLGSENCGSPKVCTNMVLTAFGVVPGRQACGQ